VGGKDPNRYIEGLGKESRQEVAEEIKRGAMGAEIQKTKSSRKRLGWVLRVIVF